MGERKGCGCDILARPPSVLDPRHLGVSQQSGLGFCFSSISAVVLFF
jgi:hypothetical protein